MVEIDCHDASACHQWRPEQFREVLDVLRTAKARVAEGTMAAARYESLEVSVGLRYNPDGFVASPALASHVDPVAVATYDWVHNMLQDGVFTSEAQAFLAAAGIERCQVQAMLRDEAWCFPRCQAAKCKQLHKVFDERRVSAANSDKLKASCAEMLGVYGLLRHFVECRVRSTPDLTLKRESFFAACKVMDLLLTAKRVLAKIEDAAPALKAATEGFLVKHKLAYGVTNIKPKHHWQLDVPEQIRRDGLVLDAFVIERTHLRVKGVAEHIRNTTRFEGSTLASLANVMWQNAAELSSCSGLVGRSAPWPGCPGLVVADHMEFFSARVSVDDVVLRGDKAAIVTACCTADGELVSIVQQCAFIRRMSEHTHVFRPTDGLEAWPAKEIRLSLAWRRRDDHCLIVVVQ